MISTPDLADLNTQAFHLPFQFTRFGRLAGVGGKIATVRCFEDNSRVKEAVAEPGNGRVLLVDGCGSLRRALTGDLVAASAMENGWAGMVIIGAIRDVEVIDTFEFAVFALGTSPIKTEKLGRGERDVALNFEGVDFPVESGQFLAADANGVLINQTPFLTE